MSCQVDHYHGVLPCRRVWTGVFGIASMYIVCQLNKNTECQHNIGMTRTPLVDAASTLPRRYALWYSRMTYVKSDCIYRTKLLCNVQLFGSWNSASVIAFIQQCIACEMESARIKIQRQLLCGGKGAQILWCSLVTFMEGDCCNGTQVAKRVLYAAMGILRIYKVHPNLSPASPECKTSKMVSPRDFRTVSMLI